MKQATGIVAMTGATGFTGRRVAQRLAEQGESLRCLVRPTSGLETLPAGVATVCGDLGDPTSLDRLLNGAEALVYCASMGFGQVPGVVAACERAGVRRAVFVSTTAIFTRLPARSKVIRTEAEDAVRGSTLAWTIVRPTMIYGAPGDRNFERLLRALKRWPLLPIAGRGDSLLQPVHVDDLAAVLASALRSEAAVTQEYDVSGREALSFRETIRLAAEAVGKPGRLFSVPLRPASWFLGLCERLGLTLPLRQEQILRLAEDKNFGHQLARRDLGFAPRSFAEGIAQEALSLGLSSSGHES